MKNKTAVCSTGHDTGVIQRKPPSWPPPGMAKATRADAEGAGRAKHLAHYQRLIEEKEERRMAVVDRVAAENKTKAERAQRDAQAKKNRSIIGRIKRFMTRKVI